MIKNTYTQNSEAAAIVYEFRQFYLEDLTIYLNLAKYKVCKKRRNRRHIDSLEPNFAMYMKISQLEKIGFSNNEAKIYLAALELSNGTAQSIADRCGLPKSTAYDAIKKLRKNGLMHSYLKGKRTYFSPADPEHLKKRIEVQNDALNEIFPELDALYGTSEQKPCVRYFEGKKGLGIVLKEILEEAKELICISSIQDLFDKLSEYYPQFTKQRIAHKIPIRIIARDSEKARDRQKMGPQELRVVKIIHTDIPFKALVYIWNNKVAMMTLKEDFMIVVVESKDIALTHKALFEWLWTM